MTAKGYSAVDMDLEEDRILPHPPIPTPFRSSIIKLGFGLLGFFALTLPLIYSDAASSTTPSIPNETTSITDGNRFFDPMKRFILEDYDARPTFSNFLPGVAGIYGKPVWSFYVNRGQGMTAFGTTSKDFPILEFNPANKAYQDAALVGFRTFINVTLQGDKESTLYEPFSPLLARNTDSCDANDDDTSHTSSNHLPKRRMFVGANEFEIEEVSSSTGLTTNVVYFVLPEEDFGSLVRTTTITNTNAKPVKMSVLDGLAKMEPVGGLLDGQLKNMGRTLEGWMDVYQGDETEGGLTMPFYRLSTVPGDTASVQIEKEGHYCLSFVEGEGESPNLLLPILYDTDKVFGQDTSLIFPAGLKGKSLSEVLKLKQSGAAKTSSAFAAATDIVLEPNKSVTITSFYGKAPTIESLSDYAETVTQQGYASEKLELARKLIDEITASVATKTSNDLMNGHIKQMFLDNALRGGVPVIYGDLEDENASGKADADEDPSLKVYHAFSRIHGDLERDYNAFNIDSTFFSQGPGNYRDVAQNRRNDVLFNPRIGASGIKQFLSFIQADGYEPLTVEAVVFNLKSETTMERIASKFVDGGDESETALINILKGGTFRPGQLFDLMEKQDINIKKSFSRDEFINELLSEAGSMPSAAYGDGFWADHWTYYLDMINSYLSIFPEREEQLMFGEGLPYFYSPATVHPRDEKYVETPIESGNGFHIQQLGATTWDTEKESKQSEYLDVETGLVDLINANWQHSSDGKIFTSSPIAKLLLLATTKFSMRDAYGMGVEYEGGKPGWNDAMNGLVGQLGSGMPESYELSLLLKYIEKVCRNSAGSGSDSNSNSNSNSVEVPKELKDLVDSIEIALDTLDNSGFSDELISQPEMNFTVPEELFSYWDSATTAREKFNKKVKYSFDGETHSYTPTELSVILKRWILHTEIGLDRAMKISSLGDGDDGSSGVSPSYFSFAATSWETTGSLNDNGRPYCKVLGMKVGTFPLFLEGAVRHMKTFEGEGKGEKNEKMYELVKGSGLYDEELNSYTVSASLKGQSYDMGRMMSFSPGWLENQSIWVHMSMKYMLQLCRGGMYETFFEELVGGGMLPFMDQKRYGRSLLEASSFIPSSAFPDENQWGRGFLARLSGSTAEFLSIWAIMFVGEKPFGIEEGGEGEGVSAVEMKLSPALPGWMFDEAGELSFKLFGEITVVYHNKSGKNLLGGLPSRYEVELKDRAGGGIEFVVGGVIGGELATKIRKVDVVSIDAYFD